MTFYFLFFNSCSLSPISPTYVVINCFNNVNTGLLSPQPKPTKGRMRIHCLENVDKALQFLKEQKVHLENMGSHDIVDGNHRLTLGLIWTIILRFQVTYKVAEYSTAHILSQLSCHISPRLSKRSLTVRHLVSACSRVHPQANSQNRVKEVTATGMWFTGQFIMSLF